MKLLHTSDWHIGRTFHGADLLAEQEAVLGHLADLVVAESVDVVLVSGDIYDRAVPSAEAVRVATTALGRLRQAGAQLVMTPGNHDSAPRLGAFAEFAAAGGLHLRATIDGIAEPVLLPDEHGDVALYGIPYLEPEPARHALGVPEARGHTGVLTEAMRRIRADLAERPQGTRSVVLAHAFVTGGEPTESERTIAVGGVEQVPGSVFDGVDYVALGHLHGPQTLAEHLRYSGSPLAYSFSETRQRKSVWLVDLGADGLAEVRRHELPVPRQLAMLSGELADLLSDPEHDGLTDHFLSFTITDRVRPIDAMRKLRERFPYAVHLDWQPEGGHAGAALKYAEAVRGRSDVEITRGFLEDCRGSAPTESEERLVLAALGAAGREREV
ncbi:exonuclease SbcCD subunit D [Amycolatopsis sp. BJA-103]|uniref:exonuclease SbcCD subunit D n=1 Tax=unclassified Amycolatopsis TaxID=2618356 RepID=UPI000CA2CC2F|nr:exonuclease SbcCD subunit D [Amycolatopsis sp. BJA-103]AUI61564.1 exonuclease SbcCD subunit D [Amycolatopsis sp. BJA-103]PNE21142.1 exonuclease SbcCD subunit D [Amycolatopsis sp. BJA-103]